MAEVGPEGRDAKTGEHPPEHPRPSARSWLFVPGDRPRFLAKVSEISADAVVLDLEDGAGDKGDLARANVASWIGSAAAAVAPALFVRTRGVNHPGFRDDVQAVVGPRLAGLVLPKVGSAAEVRLAVEVSEAFARRVGAPTPPLVLIVESAAGLEALPAMLAVTEAVVAVAFGAEDFAADMGLAPAFGAGSSSALLDHARARIAVASAAAEVPWLIDTPCLDIHDEARLTAEVTRALTFGFTGKFLIHPGQVEPLHRALMPTEPEIAWAESLLATVPDGAGAVRVEGRMVDEAVLRQARRLLQRGRKDDSRQHA